MRPTVTILMPVFNSQRYLKAAIDSILEQSYTDFELLLLDDGSTDGSLTILNNIKDKRVHVLADGQNLRQPSRYNQGVQLAQGKYIAIMHADDIALPNRLEVQVAFLEANPDYDLVGSKVSLIYENKRSKRLMGLDKEGDYLRLFNLFNCAFIHPTVLCRKEVLEQIPYAPSFTTAEDYELWSRILPKYKAANIAMPLLAYRVHSQKNAKRHKTQQLLNVATIVKRQLTDLGISYAPEWEQCSQWVSNSYLDALTQQELGEVEQYLLTIQAELLANSHFQAAIVRQCVADTWLRVCMKSSRTGMKVGGMYLRSPLSSRNRWNIKKSGLLAVKCLLRK